MKPGAGRRARRLALALIAAAILVPLGAGLWFLARFDPDAERPALIQALHRATGAEVRIGHLGVRIVPPCVVADDVMLIGPPGRTPFTLSLHRLVAVPDWRQLLHRAIMPHRLRGEGGQLLWHGQTVMLPVLNAVIGDGGVPTLDADWRSADLSGTAQLRTGALATGPYPLSLHLTADLGALLPGLRLDNAQLSQSAASAPVAVQADGILADAPLRLNGTITPPKRQGQSPWALALQAGLGGSTVQLRGTLADPQTLTGVSLLLSAQVPDLAELWPLADHPLPPLHDIALAAVLQDDGGLRQGVVLRDIRIRSPKLDTVGEAAARFGPHPIWHAVLNARHLDADALTAAWQAARPAPAPAAAGAPPPGTHPTALFGDQALPFAALHHADADILAQVDELQLKNSTYRAVSAHLRVADGQLQLNPVTAETPAGPAHLQFAAADGAVHLAVAAPSLGLQPLLAWAGIRGTASGTVLLQAEFAGQGTTPHQIAASLQGRLGLSLVNGSLQSQGFDRLLQGLQPHAESLLPPPASTTAIRCIALRADARHGQLGFPVLLADTSRLMLTGGGMADLGAERLQLQLQPTLWVGGGITLPVQLNGALRDPGLRIGLPIAARPGTGEGTADCHGALEQVWAASP